MIGRLLITGVVVMLWTAAVMANNLGVVGRTWPIAETDALTEIEARARQVDWNKIIDKKKVENFQGPPDRVSLPRAKRNRSFPVDLTYTTDIDVPDGKGGILYPKGYTFNPLDYVTYPKTIVVIDGSDPEQVKWLAVSEYATRLDVTLLLIEGRYGPVAKRVKRPVFYANRKIIDRFGLKAVPSIIRQKGRLMEVTEFALPVGTSRHTAATRKKQEAP
jgi:conjugal transfer pilus assembly protein TraW